MYAIRSYYEVAVGGKDIVIIILVYSTAFIGIDLHDIAVIFRQIEIVGQGTKEDVR